MIAVIPERVAGLAKTLERRGIRLAYFADGALARAFVLGEIPKGAAVMSGGSHTLACE